MPLPADVRKALASAFQTGDAETAWYLDLVLPRVVHVRRGATNIPDLSASEVEDNELRYVEIPAITESEVHLWMEDFVEEQGDPEVADMLDEKLGANERFVESLGRSAPTALAAWTAYRARRVAAVVDAWLAEVSA